jgi:serine/threonine protein kinase
MVKKRKYTLKKRKIIGEGSYGCVHKPSLHCLKDSFDQKIPKNYENYVSKIMKTEDAQKELDEFLVIKTYDRENEYHLGTPILCQPELNNKIINKDIAKCKYIKSADIKKNPNDYKLLLIDFGGPDLKQLCNAELKKYLAKNTTTKSDQFWLEVHHLLKGIQFFKKNGLVHNDIKPQNILFNLKTGKLVFIDFGLTRSKKEIIKSSKESDNFLGIYHWSYPFECGLMNQKKYNAFKGLSAARKKTYKSQLCEMIINNKNKNTFAMSIKNPNAFNILFAYINPDGEAPSEETKYEYMDHFFDGLNHLITKNSYDDVLNRIIDSIDVYGLGFTLQYILNCFYRNNAVNDEFLNRMSAFFHKMYDFNPETRETNIDALIDEYEAILLETGILTRLKKSFKNHIVSEKQFPANKKRSKSKKVQLSSTDTRKNRV